MNIKHRCPCGQWIEVTGLSTRQVAAVDTILQPWLDDHEPHRQQALAAHVTNLATRRSPSPLCPATRDDGKPCRLLNGHVGHGHLFALADDTPAWDVSQTADEQPAF